MTFEQLSPRDKQIVELLALGFSDPEIAADLGSTSNAIKLRVHRLCIYAGAERRMRLLLHFYALTPKCLAPKSPNGF